VLFWRLLLLRGEFGADKASARGLVDGCGVADFDALAAVLEGGRPFHDDGVRAAGCPCRQIGANLDFSAEVTGTLDGAQCHG